MAVRVMTFQYCAQCLCELFVRFSLGCFVDIEAGLHFLCNFSMRFANKFDTTL